MCVSSGSVVSEDGEEWVGGVGKDSSLVARENEARMELRIVEVSLSL